jgi:hypothetical protein
MDRGTVVFALYLEHAHRVLLFCFHGRFTLDDIARCDRAVMLTLGREGPVRGIVDLSDVETFDLPIDRLMERARQPPMAAGQARIFVATKPAILDFARSYAAMQREFGSDGPQVVGTRAEAYKILGLIDPKFEPLELP